MEATECGAASLSMILAYFGRHVPLEQLRVLTGVSRDGCNAANIKLAAQHFGLDCHAYKKKPAAMRTVDTPCILYWNRNHFVVLEGFCGKWARINDPGCGRRWVAWADFEQSFSGIVLTFSKNNSFRTDRQIPRTDDSKNALLPGNVSFSGTVRFSERLKHAVFSEGTILLPVFVTGLLPTLMWIVLSMVFGFLGDHWLSDSTAGWPGIVIATIVIWAASEGLKRIVRHYCRRKIFLQSAMAFLRHMLRLPVSFYNQRYAGDLVDRAERSRIHDSAFPGAVAAAAARLVSAVLYWIVLVKIAPGVAWFAPVYTAVLLMILVLMQNAASEAGQKSETGFGELYGVCCEGIHLADTIKASGSEKTYTDGMQDIYEKTLLPDLRYQFLSLLVQKIPKGCLILAETGIVMMGGMAASKGAQTAGGIIASALVFFGFADAVRHLVSFAQKTRSMCRDLNRTVDVLRFPEDVRYQTDPQQRDKWKLFGTISMKGVTFGYQVLDKPLIEQFDLQILSGDMVALIGPSGCGKSTILKLISGLYRPVSGEICYDGVPADRIPKEVLSAGIASVDQQIVFFSGSVRDNITMKNPAVAEADVIAAAKDACIHDFIMQLPGGYDYDLTEDGANLSGGQRQRLEIARALATNPSVLIMDEATSALDPVTEKEVLDHIRQRGCTCVIAAHRFSAYREADRVIRLDHGKVQQEIDTKQDRKRQLTETEEQQRKLDSTEIFMTEAPDAVYKIVKGTADIYIAPLKQGKASRRVWLCEAGQGDVLPSFSYRDTDYREWRFLICARDSLVIKKLPWPCTNVLRSRFAQRVQLKHYEKEGFVQGIIAFYVEAVFRDRVFIEKSSKEEKKAGDAAHAMAQGRTALPEKEPVAAQAGHAAQAAAQEDPAGRRKSQKLTEDERLLYRSVRKSLRPAELAVTAGISAIVVLIGMVLPAAARVLFDRLIPSGQSEMISRLGADILMMVTGGLLLILIRRFYELKMENRAAERVQKMAFERLFKLPERFFDSFDSAALAEHLVFIAPAIGMLVHTMLNSLIWAVILPVCLIRMWLCSWELSLAALVLAGVCTVCAVWNGKTAAAWRRQVPQGRAGSLLYQYFRGIEKIRLAGVEERALRDYMMLVTGEQTLKKDLEKRTMLQAGIMRAAGIVYAAAVCVITAAGPDRISIGLLIAYCIAAAFFFTGCRMLRTCLSDHARLRTMIRQFMPILMTECEDTKDAVIPEKVRGNISVRQVSFTYPEDPALAAAAPEPVLRGISLDIREGEYIGIVGASGCGKTTLLKLLLGLYEPTEGEILYDGQDLRSLNKQALRRQLGVVLQNGRLAAGSILDNVRIACPDADVSEVEDALERVGLMDEIRRMPMGVYTLLSEHGDTLSEGQKQRLMIARAILHHPAILIFDEATSALDNEAQDRVRTGLDASKVTRIVAAHRLSTIRRCDRILVMDRGQIAEEGSYDALMCKKGLFYQLAERQLDEET